MTRDSDGRDESGANEPTRLFDTSRRAFIKIAAGAGVVGGVAGLTGAQPAETFRFGGEVAGWRGRDPQRISGETNPTLDLQVGNTYDIVWENVDGLPHNFVVADAQGNVMRRTEIISEEGATQQLSLRVEAGMATYYCEVHPTSMRGDINVQGAGQQTTQEAAPEQRYVPEGPRIGLQQVAGGPIQQPVAFAIADEDRDRRFIVDQNGYIFVHGPNGLEEEPFLNIHDRLHYLTPARGGFERSGNFDERGLLGLAFHPNFQQNRRFFVRYSAELTTPPYRGGRNWEGRPEDYDHLAVLAEFRASEDLSTADPESERRLLEIPEPQFNHNAGDIDFGPDGYLYVTLGDGGGADDTGIGHVDDWYNRNNGGNGQDTRQNLLGSILRIDVDSQEDGKPYGIPDDNPLVGTNYGLPEHYAWGFRNPWRFSFNRGQLFVADVGQNRWEEVDIVEKGGNYGWNVREGFHCFSTENPSNPPQQCPTSTPDNVRGGEPLLDPILEYPHTYQGQSVGISVTGGYVYYGDTLSQLQGQYVFGDWSRSFSDPRGRLFVARPQEATGTTQAGTETAATTQAGTETQAAGMGAGAQETQTTEAGTQRTTRGGQPPTDQRWSMQELVVEGGQNGEINRFVLAFGRDANGEIYVLTSETNGLQGNGAVYRIVPPGQGEQISAPPQPTTTAETQAETETTRQATTEGPSGEGEQTETTTENGG